MCILVYEPNVFYIDRYEANSFVLNVRLIYLDKTCKILKPAACNCTFLSVIKRVEFSSEKGRKKWDALGTTIPIYSYVGTYIKSPNTKLR